MTTSNRTSRRLTWFSKFTRPAETKRDNCTPYNPDNIMTTVPCEDAICPPRQLTEILVSKARDLQMLPNVAVRAIEISEDIEATAKDLSDVITLDPKLTMDLLALSNSSIFGWTEKLTSIQQAVSRVGFRQTKNMIMASCVTSMMQTMSWKEVETRDLLCNHSLLTAIIASRLNRLLKLGLQGEEFTAGLVHDIGRTLLAVSIPDEFEKFDSVNFVEGEEQLELETSSIGTTHCEIGAWFLQRNHLPEELVMAARYHHDPTQSTKFKRLIALVAAADDLANFYHREGLEGEYEVLHNRNLKLLERLGVEDARMLVRDHGQTILAETSLEVGQMLRM